MKVQLPWRVAIKEADGQLVEVAAVDCEGRASFLAAALREKGMESIFYLTEGQTKEAA